MSHDKVIEKLVYKLNQVGRFHAHMSAAQAEAGIAEHVQQFWDPRMRAQIFAHLDQGGAGLDPLPRAALQHLRAPAA
jgi:formate dehydrogenase subunit delta